MNPNHLTDEQLIDTALGDEIPGAAMHLRGCAECEAEVQIYRDVMAVTLDLPEPPPGFFDEVWDNVRHRLPRRRRRRRIVPILAAVAAAVIAVIAGLTVWRAAKTPPAGPTRPPEAHVAPPAKKGPPAPVGLQEEVQVKARAPKTFYAPPGKEPRPEPSVVPRQQYYVEVTATDAPPPPTAEEVAIVAGMARNDPSADRRIVAIRQLAHMGGDAASDALVALYPTEAEANVRWAIVSALLMQWKPAAVETLASQEKDPALQHEIQTTLQSWRAKMHAANPSLKEP